jgi:divalent metal cation (Fe/Co/Zn/Cd) transporter
MAGPSDIILAIVMIVALLLAIGGFHLILKRREPRKGTLMIIAAIVFLGNVLIWTV